MFCTVRSVRCVLFFGRMVKGSTQGVLVTLLSDRLLAADFFVLPGSLLFSRERSFILTA